MPQCAWVTCKESCDNSNCWTKVGKVCTGCYNKEFCTVYGCKQVRLCPSECNLCYEHVPKGEHWKEKAGSVSQYFDTAEDALQFRKKWYKEQRKKQQAQAQQAGQCSKDRAGGAASARFNPYERKPQQQQQQPMCPYAGHCYRKAPEHWRDFGHGPQVRPVRKPTPHCPVATSSKGGAAGASNAGGGCTVM